MSVRALKANVLMAVLGLIEEDEDWTLEPGYLPAFLGPWQVFGRMKRQESTTLFGPLYVAFVSTR